LSKKVYQGLAEKTQERRAQLPLQTPTHEGGGSFDLTPPVHMGERGTIGCHEKTGEKRGSQTPTDGRTMRPKDILREGTAGDTALVKTRQKMGCRAERRTITKEKKVRARIIWR